MNEAPDNTVFNAQQLLPSKEINVLIYLVDEDIEFSNKLCSDIINAGLIIKSFINLEEFSKAYKTQKPAIIICETDFNGRNNSGIQEVIRLEITTKTKIPVLFISKKDDILTRLSVVRSGGSLFFTKPLSNDTIVTSLISYINLKNQSKLRVLLVNDDEKVLSHHFKILDKNKFTIQIEQEPLKVLATLTAFDPEVLVLDSYMSDCSGFELAKIIHQKSKYRDLPIIFVIDEKNTEYQLEDMDAGADDFLTKPIKVDYFNRLVYARAARNRQINDLENDRKNKSHEARFLRIAMDQHSIVSATNAAGKITFVNEKFCDISGYSRHELIGKTHAIVNSGYHDELFFKVMWKQISSGKAWHGEVCNRNKNGEIYWVKSSIVPFLDDQNIPNQYISIRTDITNIKTSEELAKQKELLVYEHHKAILELAKDETLLTHGLETSLQVIFEITAKLMHAQRISIWEFDEESKQLICKSSYTTSDEKPFITNQLNISIYQYFVKNFENRSILHTTEAQKELQTKEIFKSYLGPCKILSKMDIAMYTEGKFSGILFIETTKKPYNWDIEHENFAKNISETISQRILAAKTIESQKDLAISESRLRRSQEKANIGTWDWNIKTGKLVWSDRVALLFGYETAIPDATYNTFYSIIHPEDRELVIKSIKACIEGDEDYNLEHRIITRRGETRWLATQGSVNRDKYGNPLNMLCLVQDIHNRKMLEHNVSRQKSLLDTIRVAITEFVDSSQTKNIAKTLLPDLLKLTGSECGFIGAIHHQNNVPIMHTQAISTTRWKEGDNKAYDLNKVGGPVFSKFSDLMDITMLRGEVVISNNPKEDSRILTKTNNDFLFPGSYLGIPIIYGNETIGMFGLANRPDGYDEDVIQFLQPFTLTYGVIIHAQKMAIKDLEQRDAIILARETAEKANRAKSLFLSNMSHELRTPLNAILGFAQLLSMKDQNNPLNEIQLESVKEIGVAGEHLLTLISDILDLSKIETGISDLDIENFSLDSLLKECQGMLSPLADENNIQLNIEFKDIKLRSDRQRLKQILLNLTSNAIKYNKPNGQVDITNKMTRSGFIRIGIKDTGIGIPQNLQENLFQSFQRLGAEKTNIQGTGIGLVIAKSMTEYLSGELSFESIEDQGSQFWIDIPNDLSPNVVATQANSCGTINSLPTSTALIIDTDMKQLELFSHLFLIENQYNILHLESIEKIEQLLAEQHKIDLILVDIESISSEIASFCSRVKQNPSSVSAKLIAVGTDISEIEQADILALGFHSYLTKPINEDLFFSSINA